MCTVFLLSPPSGSPLQRPVHSNTTAVSRGSMKQHSGIQKAQRIWPQLPSVQLLRAPPLTGQKRQACSRVYEEGGYVHDRPKSRATECGEASYQHQPCGADSRAVPRGDQQSGRLAGSIITRLNIYCEYLQKRRANTQLHYIELKQIKQFCYKIQHTDICQRQCLTKVDGCTPAEQGLQYHSLVGICM